MSETPAPSGPGRDDTPPGSVEVGASAGQHAAVAELIR
jgi:hypothetical protein